MRFGILCLMLMFGVFSLPASAKDLAKVNGQVITDKDLTAALSSLNEGQRQKFLSDSDSKRQVLFNVIDAEVLSQKAEQDKLDQEQEFQEALKLYRKQLLMDHLLRKEIGSQLTEKATKAFYETHKDRYSTTQVRVHHILLSNVEDAEKMLLRAKDPGADFQDLAEKHSKDPSAKNNRGDIGFLGRFGMDSNFTEAAFAAGEGEIVGPIQTSFGYHIIKVVKKVFGKPLEFYEVELKAKNDLRQILVQNYTDKVKKEFKIQFVQ